MGRPMMLPDGGMAGPRGWPGHMPPLHEVRMNLSIISVEPISVVFIAILFQFLHAPKWQRRLLI